MPDTILQSIINELGPTGLLVCGLYFLLGRPLTSMKNSLKTINKELGEIRDIGKAFVSKMK